MTLDDNTVGNPRFMLALLGRVPHILDDNLFFAGLTAELKKFIPKGATDVQKKQFISDLAQRYAGTVTTTAAVPVGGSDTAPEGKQQLAVGKDEAKGEENSPSSTPPDYVEEENLEATVSSHGEAGGGRLNEPLGKHVSYRSGAVSIGSGASRVSAGTLSELSFSTIPENTTVTSTGVSEPGDGWENSLAQQQQSNAILVPSRQASISRASARSSHGGDDSANNASVESSHGQQQESNTILAPSRQASISSASARSSHGGGKSADNALVKSSHGGGDSAKDASVKSSYGGGDSVKRLANGIRRLGVNPRILVKVAVENIVDQLL